MPLVKRQIQPVYVSRVKLEKGLVDEFECVSVSTLSGIIRQISSLAKYSEDVFDEILHEAKSIQMRATSLQGRISGLAEKVTQLDSNVEESMYCCSNSCINFWEFYRFGGKDEFVYYT